MPCVSDYLEATGGEKELSRVLCLLGELKGTQWDKSEWDGYHAAAYNKFDKKFLDCKTEELCTKLKTTDVTKFSLELQIWWRDHQIADAKRIAAEANDEDSLPAY